MTPAVYRSMTLNRNEWGRHGAALQADGWELRQVGGAIHIRKHISGPRYSENEGWGSRTMKVYITKYALTMGIYEREAEVCAEINPNMISVKEQYGDHYYFHKPDWHTTREAAVERAEAVRAAKIASHRKSIAKLEKMGFA